MAFPVAAVIAAVASYLGSKKSSKASKVDPPSELSAYRNKYSDVLKTLEESISSTDYSSPFVSGAKNYYNEIMSDDYKAISDDELDRIYNQRKENLYKDVINPEDEKLAAKLALSGQTGGGVASGNWEDKSYQNKRLLSDAYNELQNMGLTQTLANKQSALSLSPSLYNMQSTQQNAPLSAWSLYAGLLGDEESRILNQYATASGLSSSQAASSMAQSQALGNLAGILAKYWTNSGSNS